MYYYRVCTVYPYCTVYSVLPDWTHKMFPMSCHLVYSLWMDMKRNVKGEFRADKQQ